jgi:2-methylcitrate dehydratase PrpD
MGAAFRHAARMTVKTRDGRILRREILHRRGSPENPLQPEDVEYKFRNVARSCLSQAHTDKVMKLVGSLDTLDSTAELIGILGAPTAS